MLALAVFSSCAKKNSAPVVNHGKGVYGKSKNNSKNKYEALRSEQKQNVAAEKNIVIEKKSENNKTSNASQTKQETAQSKVVEVEAGQTLYSISKKYQTPLRDLIEANNLSAPYAVKSGTKIIIPQPTYYQVKSGDTLYSVSRQLQMNINDIIALNDLKQPYNLTTGQFIKVKQGAPASNVMSEKTAEKKEIAAKNVAIAAKNAEPSATKVEAAAEKIIEHKNNKFSWPIKGAIISKFGPKNGGLYNDGINIKAKEGTPVKASEDGLAAYVGNELKGYGNLVIIKHSNGWITAYGHLSKTNVKRGEKIKKGRALGLVGSTGNVDLPQLYFGLRKGRDAVNPEKYLVN